MNIYTLDTEQQQTLLAISPTIINAAAGSGKTRCLVAKILQLINQGVPPNHICALTFTNKAANEMKERLKQQCDIKDMQVSTIHSLCVRIMKTFIKYTSLNLPFSIYDDSDQLSVIKTIVKSRELLRTPEEYLSNISYIKSKGDENLLQEDFLEVYRAYQNILFKNNACDFDDLLINALTCLKQSDCSAYFIDLWKHILVDEFQDTSLIQYKIIERLYDPKKTQTLFIIGDHNQSIYGWRNANPENINEFIKKYNPSICHLTHNYRSCKEIINLANNFLQYGKPMIAKSSNSGKVSFTQFFNQEDEAEKIADAIIKLGDPENTAILFRVNTRTLLFEKTFARRQIPYKIVGALPYYKRRIAKDLLSYLKASANKADFESLIRIVNVPKRGFGDKKQEQLLTSGWPYLKRIALENPLIQSLIDLLDYIKDMQPSEAIQEILSKTGYKEHLKEESDLIMLNSFIDVVSGFNTVEELILASTFLEKDTGHGVKLMTAHASKGLEFNNVFVVGVEEGLWPHKFSENIAEERRLYYVAITRAKRWLNLSYSKSRFYRGTRLDVNPSFLFLNSMTEKPII